MKFLLCMMILGVSNAGRIPRSFDALQIQDNFPNLQTVHHGHGATSYQNFQMENHGEISIPTKSYTSHLYVHPEQHDRGLHEYNEVSSVTALVPYLNENEIENGNNFFVSEDPEPYTSNNIEHIEINDVAEPSSAYYDQHVYDQEYDYGYH